MSTSAVEENPLHQPVLYHQIILALRPRSPGKYVDATIGAGGHASGILQHSSPDGLLLGMDLDPTALAITRNRLSHYGNRAILVHTSYTTLARQLQSLSWTEVQGILIDLGVSSMQLDTPTRGFSFQSEGPLDMRFDADSGPSAADLVNNLSEAELADLIWRYGEERQSRRIARAIVRSRPLQTTTQLTCLIQKTIGGKSGGIHPATRTFQALRIAVNQELQALQAVLPQCVQALAPGGRVAIISFHSLEDRLVKEYFRKESRDCICDPVQAVCTCNHQAVIKEITRRPLMASEEEIQQNSRARSARLRVAEKLKLA